MRVDSARMLLNPPTPSGDTVASAPPQIIASASPRSMTRAASPIACAPVEHADTCDMFGPLAPNRIESCPGARLTMIIGTKNGEMPCRGPFSQQRLARRLDGADAAQAGADEAADPLGELALDLEPGVRHRQRPGGDGVLDELVDAS